MATPPGERDAIARCYCLGDPPALAEIDEPGTGAHAAVMYGDPNSRQIPVTAQARDQHRLGDHKSSQPERSPLSHRVQSPDCAAAAASGGRGQWRPLRGGRRRITMPGQPDSRSDGNVAAHQAEVFAYSAAVSAALASRIEAEMTDQEVQAVTTSRPAPYVHDVVTSCRMRTRARPAAAPTGSSQSTSAIGGTPASTTPAD
jgi:hypothetical protein